MDYCEANGNQGFPVPISGTLAATDTTYTNIFSEPLIYSAFAARTSHARLMNQNTSLYMTNRKNLIDDPSASSSTLTYAGDRFVLRYVQVALPVGGSPWPTSPAGSNIADIYFTFESEFGGSPTSPRAIHLIVPLYTRESIADPALQTPDALNYFQQTIYSTDNDENLESTPKINSLATIFKDFRGNPGYVQYSTCLQARTIAGTKYGLKQINQVALFFPSGWILPEAIINRLGDKTTTNASFEEFRLSRGSRFSLEVNTIAPPATGRDAWLTNLQNWSVHGRCLRGSPVSIGGNDFTKRFRFIKKGLITFSEAGGSVQKRTKSTFEYRCLPIDRVKDIDGTNVLLDPATGSRTLAQALQGTPAQQAQLNLSVNPDAMSNLEIFAIVLGAIAAIITGLVLLSFATRFFLQRQGTPEGNDQAGFFSKMLSVFKRSTQPQPA
jgi:hypothetical protein